MLAAALIVAVPAAVTVPACQAFTRAPLTGTMDQVYADAVDGYAAAGAVLVAALDADLIPPDAVDDVIGLNDATRNVLVGLEQAARADNRATFETRLAEYRRLVAALRAAAGGAE